jgi:hypothetical protein
VCGRRDEMAAGYDAADDPKGAKTGPPHAAWSLVEALLSRAGVLPLPGSRLLSLSVVWPLRLKSLSVARSPAVAGTCNSEGLLSTTCSAVAGVPPCAAIGEGARGCVLSFHCDGEVGVHREAVSRTGLCTGVLESVVPLSCDQLLSAGILLTAGTLVKGSAACLSPDVIGSEDNKVEGSSRISDRNLAPALG